MKSYKEMFETPFSPHPEVFDIYQEKALLKSYFSVAQKQQKTSSISDVKKADIQEPEEKVTSEPETGLAVVEPDAEYEVKKGFFGGLKVRKIK